ncbi:MAG: hypothetical protein ACREOP_01605 [Thermodesulfobacteriota bacterium]
MTGPTDNYAKAGIAHSLLTRGTFDPNQAGRSGSSALDALIGLGGSAVGASRGFDYEKSLQAEKMTGLKGLQELENKGTATTSLIENQFLLQILDSNPEVFAQLLERAGIKTEKKKPRVEEEEASKNYNDVLADMKRRLNPFNMFR